MSVNGVRQNESAAQNVTVKNLPFEVYGVDIELAGTNLHTRGIAFLRIGQVSNYILTKVGDELKLVDGQGNEKPYNQQNVAINFKLQVDSVVPNEITKAEEYAELAAPAINFDDEPGEFGLENTTPAQEELKPQAKVDPEKLRFDADSMFRSIKEHMNKQYSDQPCNGSLAADTLKLLKNKMRETPTLRDRYNQAYRGVGNLCVTVGQVKELMRLLDGDELKVEFYKDVHKNIIDIARRSDLFELLFFESSIEEIQNVQ